jgi:hypothetical protein
MNDHERCELNKLVGTIRIEIRVALSMGNLEEAETLSRILRNLLDCLTI